VSLFEEKQSLEILCPTFLQPMGRIFGGFPQLSVSLINEKTEINYENGHALTFLSVTGRHRSCAKSRHEKADWIVVGSFFGEKTRNGNFFIEKGTCNRRAYGIQSGSRVRTL